MASIQGTEGGQLFSGKSKQRVQLGKGLRPQGGAAGSSGGPLPTSALPSSQLRKGPGNHKGLLLDSYLGIPELAF